MESATGQALHEIITDDEDIVTDNDCCALCLNPFNGPEILMDDLGIVRKICIRCSKGIRRQIFFDEAQVNPYGRKNAGRLR